MENTDRYTMLIWEVVTIIYSIYGQFFRSRASSIPQTKLNFSRFLPKDQKDDDILTGMVDDRLPDRTFLLTRYATRQEMYIIFMTGSLRNGFTQICASRNLNITPCSLSSTSTANFVLQI